MEGAKLELQGAVLLQDILISYLICAEVYLCGGGVLYGGKEGRERVREEAKEYVSIHKCVGGDLK